MDSERFTRRKSQVVPGISDSVRVAAGDLLFVSGVVGFNADGSVPEDFARAVELTFRELGRALNAGGADFSDLARINIYITNLDQAKLSAFRSVRDTFLAPESVPASTLIGVQALYNGATVEIDAIAAV
jgi:enamine deaminase RidA (YjgF/YER057c/UK114 family)